MRLYYGRSHLSAPWRMPQAEFLLRLGWCVTSCHEFLFWGDPATLCKMNLPALDMNVVTLTYFKYCFNEILVWQCLPTFSWWFLVFNQANKSFAWRSSEKSKMSSIHTRQGLRFLSFYVSFVFVWGFSSQLATAVFCFHDNQTENEWVS